MIPFTVATLLCLVWAALRRWTGVVFVVLPVALAGYFVISTGLFAFGRDIPFDLFSRTGSTYTLVLGYVLLHFLVAYGGLLAGRLIVRRATGRMEGRQEGGGAVGSAPSATLGGMAFILAMSPAVMVVIAVGPAELLNRGQFVAQPVRPALMRVADLLFWVSVLVTPFLKRQWMRGISLVVVASAFSAIGSRAGPVLIVGYVVIRYATMRRRAFAPAVLQLCLAMVLLGYLLFLRQHNAGGIESFRKYAGVVSMSDLGAQVMLGVNYLTNYSVTVNAWMLEQGRVSTDGFLYAVSPIPSALWDLTAWYDAENRFRKNIPYPGFGYSLKYLGSVMYGCAVFVLFFAVEVMRRTLVTRRDALEKLLYYGWVFIPFLVSLQYNLRTATRLGYLLVAVYLLHGVIRRMRLFAGVRA